MDVPQEESFNQGQESFEKALSDTNTLVDQSAILIETLPIEYSLKMAIHIGESSVQQVSSNLNYYKYQAKTRKISFTTEVSEIYLQQNQTLKINDREEKQEETSAQDMEIIPAFPKMEIILKIEEITPFCVFYSLKHKVVVSR